MQHTPGYHRKSASYSSQRVHRSRDGQDTDRKDHLEEYDGRTRPAYSTKVDTSASLEDFMLFVGIEDATDHGALSVILGRIGGVVRRFLRLWC